VVTVSVVPELTLSVAVLGLLLLKISEWIVAIEVTVTDDPARIIAVSPPAGTAPPVQVVPLLQLPPAAVEIFVAPRPASAPMKVIMTTSNMGNSLFTFICAIVWLCFSHAFQCRF
jgi:hypothetical protein